MNRTESAQNNRSEATIGCFDPRDLREKTQTQPRKANRGTISGLDEPFERVDQKWADAPIDSVIHHLVREHQSWRAKDFPMIEYLFDCLEGSRVPPRFVCFRCDELFTGCEPRWKDTSAGKRMYSFPKL